MFTRHFRNVAVSLFCLAGLAAAQQTAPTPPPQAAGYNLVFDDEFDSLSLSPKGNGAFTWYEGIWFNHQLAPLANVSTSSSILNLVWNRGQGSSDTSIETLSHNAANFRAWRYGYFEASFKWNVVPGAWPAFWMIPVQDANFTDVYNGVKESGEIDIFEGQGDQPYTYFGTWHDWANGVSSSNKINYFKLSHSTDLTQFHKYGVLWTPGTLTWYLDDVPLHTETNIPAIFDKEDFFLVLGMQEGAQWSYGNLNGVSANSLALNADWVRVWQLPASK